MFFSIITVTYNAQDSIQHTLKSIASQTCKDYELIVVDGQSIDHTMQMVDNFKGMINKLKIIVESDKGIYDAMNKGVKHSKGDYIYFLNAGDCFYDKNVLENVKSFILHDVSNRQQRNKVIYYGNIVRDREKVTFPQKFSEWKWIYLEKAYFSHQAIFSSRDLLENFPFDISLRICADRDWLIRSMRDKADYICMEKITVACYEGGGVSAGFKNQQVDSLAISERYGGKKALYFVKFKRKIGELLGHER